MEYTDNEYIKLNRKIIGWEWYLNINVKTLFIHCLLKANWKDGRFEGKDIKRGSFVTSLEKLKVETGLSVQQIRTALEKLQSTGEVTSKTFSKYRIITVVNYEQYQTDNRVTNKQDNKQFNNQITSNQQASNKQVTTIEEDKNIRTKELNKELSNDNSNSQPIVHHKRIVDKWNTLKEYGVPPIRSITPNSNRERDLKARLKEFGEDSFDEIIEHFKVSKFLQGRATSFKPDFGWAVKKSWYAAILEGKYDDDRHEQKKDNDFTLDDVLKELGKDGE